MMRAMRCARCGTDEPRADGRFCRACGAPLGRPAPTVDDEGEPLVPHASRTLPAAAPVGSPGAVEWMMALPRQHRLRRYVGVVADGQR